MAKGGQRRTSKSAGSNTNDAHGYDASTEGISKIDARPHLEGSAGSKNAFPSSTSTALSALAQATIPIWVQTTVMIGLIFGGCCSNVFALEAIVKAEPQSGHLLTFAQFLLVAVEGFIFHFDPKSPTLLKPNTIPIHRWLIQILLYFSVSVLNNYAFGYKISVPVHIILRSGGSMTTLVIGWFWGKSLAFGYVRHMVSNHSGFDIYRYSRVQVFSVFILTVGIVLSAWGDSKGADESESSATQYITGLAILFIAQVISAFMGLYIEGTYTKYGNNYREGLFYSHFLSLFLFIPLYRPIKSQYTRLLASPPLEIPFPFPTPLFISKIPRQIIFLFMNALTHYVCVRGVNVLASMSSALTVTIVLNIRKLVSLLLSIYLFGNEVNTGVFVGAIVVFSGGFLYGLESQRQNRLRKMRGGGGKKMQ